MCVFHSLFIFCWKTKQIYKNKIKIQCDYVTAIIISKELTEISQYLYKIKIYLFSEHTHTAWAELKKEKRIFFLIYIN
jgi:hypothetical protein